LEDGVRAVDGERSWQRDGGGETPARKTDRKFYLCVCHIKTARL